LSKIEKTHKNLKDLRKEFALHETNVLHSDYDRGYFQALENYMRKLERSDLSAESPSEQKAKQKG